jgi:cell division septum initiation protein DivIVA
MFLYLDLIEDDLPNIKREKRKKKKKTKKLKKKDAFEDSDDEFVFIIVIK